MNAAVYVRFGIEVRRKFGTVNEIVDPMADYAIKPSDEVLHLIGWNLKRILMGLAVVVVALLAIVVVALLAVVVVALLAVVVVVALLAVVVVALLAVVGGCFAHSKVK